MLDSGVFFGAGDRCARPTTFDRSNRRSWSQKLDAHAVFGLAPASSLAWTACETATINSRHTAFTMPNQSRRGDSRKRGAKRITKESSGNASGRFRAVRKKNTKPDPNSDVR